MSQPAQNPAKIIRCQRFIFLTLLCLLLSLPGFAQSGGVILGTVTDKNTQQPIPGAVVQIPGTDAGTTTDSLGRYRIETAVGTQNIQASFLGYAPGNSYNVVVSAGNAQTVNFELQEEGRKLDEVVVGSNRSRSARAADMVTPMSTQRLSSEEIRSNPGGNFDVSRVIQVLPGVAGGTTASRNDIIVRGGAPNENVYYLDGIEIPVLNHFQTQGASGGATGILNVSFIEDVQLSSSAFDARYDNALAATFNIRQRNGNPEKAGGNIRLSGTELAATLEGPLGKRTTFLISARRSYLQFLFQALDLPIRPEFWDFQYKISHRLDEKTTLNFIGLGAIDKFRLAIPKDASPENIYTLRSNPMIDQWNYTVGVSLKRLLKNGFLNVALSRNMYENGVDQFEDNIEEEGRRNLGLRSQEAENKIRVDVNKYVNGWKYSYGVVGQYVRFNTALFNKLSNEVRDTSAGIYAPAVVVNFSSAIDFFRYGAFGQVSRRFFGERLLLSGGLRTDMNSFTTSGGNPLETLSPRLSASLSLLPGWDLTGSVGSYYKLPTYTNLGFRDSTGELVNKGMKYIHSLHYALGLQFIPRDDLRLTLEGFYKDYSNYPVSLRTGISQANGGADFSSVGNEAVSSDGRGRTYGLELFLQQKLVRKTFYALSATVYRSEFSGRDGVLRPSSWDYGYLLSATLGRKFGRGWELGLKYRLAGGAPYTPYDLIASRANYLTTGVGAFDYRRINEERLGPFQQADIRVDKKINFRKLSLNLFVDIQNFARLSSEGVPKYTFRRNADNSGFATTDGAALRPDGSNAIPVLLDNDNSTFVPTIGFIFEF